MADDRVENRDAARYPARRSEAYFGWWDDSGFRTRAAELKNLSRGGALVHVALPAPETPGLWLRLGGTSPSEWAGVSVVAEENPCEGLYRVRLKFDDALPYDVFQSAVHGPSDAGRPYAGRV